MNSNQRSYHSRPVQKTKNERAGLSLTNINLICFLQD